MPIVHELRVDSIVIGERLRPVSDAAVDELAASMDVAGLVHPISIHRPNVVPFLVTGHHRLLAARKLGWETIPTIILSPVFTDDDRLQMEIAENLHRNALTKDERDQHIRLFAELLKKKRAAGSGPLSENKAGQSVRVSEGGGRGNKGIASEIAEKTGLNQRTVRRALDPEGEQAKRETKAEAKRQRDAQQAENDRVRDEVRASLPEDIQRSIAHRSKADGGPPTAADDALSASDVEGLEETIRVLERENGELRAELQKFSEMKAEYDAGGFAEVVAGKDEVIRAQGLRIEAESAEKVQNLRSMEFWKKQAMERGWKPDVTTIDTRTGALSNG